MPLEVTCEECGQENQIEDQLAGQSFPCDHCSAIIAVPDLDVEDEASSPGEPGQFFIQVKDEPVASRVDRFEKSVQARGGLPYKIITVLGGILLVVGIRYLKSSDFLETLFPPPSKIASEPPRRFPTIDDVNASMLDDSSRWKRISPPEQSFSVLMPKEPKWRSDDPGGTKIHTGIFQTFSPTYRALVLSYTEIETEQDSGFSESEVFENLRTGLIVDTKSTPNGKVLDSKELSITDEAGHHYSGREYTTSVKPTDEQLQIVIRFYIIGKRVVIMKAITTKEFVNKFRTTSLKFLDSLKIKPN